MNTYETSTLVNEAVSIVNSDADNEAWFYEARIVIGNKYVEAYKVIDIDILRDYGVSFADKTVIELALPAGTFLKDILPYKEDLKIELTNHPLSTQFGRKKNSTITVKTYRATLIQTESPETASSNPLAKLSAEAINQMGIRRVQFQLQDIAMEQLRLIQMGTIVRQATPTALVKGLITQGSRLINVADEHAIKGVTMVEADNDEVQQHSIIPHGTRLVDIPDMVQNKLCGIYSSGLGFYLQDSMWYLWPLYNLARFDSNARKVTIILIPEDRFPGLEKTYRTTANQLIILITGGSNHFDDTEAQLTNHGNGVRYADNRKLLEGFGKVKGNKVVAHRSNNGSEFVGVERASGLNHVATVKSSNNIYRETSALAARKGSKMLAIWQNSNPDLITPAMACQVIFERNGLPVTLAATIVGTHTYVSTVDGTLNNQRHLTNTALSLFVDKNLPELKEYVQNSNVDQYSTPL